MIASAVESRRHGGEIQHPVKEFGVDLQQVLAESGLPLELFNHPDNLVSFRQGSHLLGLCACPHLGLLIGRYTPLESLGFVADLAKAAPDVRSALRLVARYLTLSDGGGLLTLNEDANVATYRYALYEPGVERAEVIYDIVLSTTWNVLRAICGSRWLPREIQFMRSRPADTHPYRSFLRAPLRFDCDRSAVVFDRAWLDVPRCEVRTRNAWPHSKHRRVPSKPRPRATCPRRCGACCGVNY